MSSDETWPPDGYSTPNEYVAPSTTASAITGGVVTIPFGLMLGDQFNTSAGRSTDWLIAAVSLDSVWSLSLLAVTAFVVFPVLATVVVHECLHYLPNAVMGLNPEFSFYRVSIVPNPAVTPLAVNISRLESIIGLLSPVVALNLLFLLLVGSGVTPVVFMALVGLFVNTIASGADIYNAIRILRFEKGTLLANFRSDGELRGEYSVPDSDPGDEL